MTLDSTFKWRDVYLQYVRSIDPDITDPGLKQVKVKTHYGLLPLVESKMLDLRETGGRREVVKAIFKSNQGYVVMTTLEGHLQGSIYRF